MGREYKASKLEVRQRKYDAFIRKTVFGGKKWVEDYCECCGNFDLLEYRNGRYVCPTCAERVMTQEANHE